MICHAIRVVILLIVATILLFATVANAGAEKPPGVVVDYSPPATGIYLGDPNIAILPNGHYIVSHDAWGPGHSYSRTYLFGSTDKGMTWKPITRLAGQYQSSLFMHDGALYLMGGYNESWDVDGFVTIRRSTDGGKTWTKPADGRLSPPATYDAGATSVVVHDGRIWRAMEKRDPAMPPNTSRNYRPFMASAPVGSDLLEASNWTISNSLLLHDFVPGLGFFEGNAVVTPNGNMVIMLRTAYRPEKATIIQVSQDGKTISFDPKTGFVDFPGGGSQFTIRYDKQTNRYWSLVNTRNTPTAVRNFLSLVSSADLANWTVDDTILKHPDSKKVAWQYVDLRFEGDDIIFVSRTAFGGAANFHDNNYITFHRIKDFRRYHRSPQRLTSGPRPTPTTQRQGLRPTSSTKPCRPPATTTQRASGQSKGKLLKGFSGRVAPVMDLDHDLYGALHTRQILDQKIRLLAKCGFKRLYIVAPPPGQPDYAIRVAPQDGPPNFLRQSRAALGDDPLRLAVKYAKAAGLEVFIQFKPYEGGGVFTVPHGFVPPCDRNWLETLGGRAVGLDPFIVKHPEFLVTRKPYDALLSQNADRIEMVFVLDRIDRGKTIKRSGGKYTEMVDKPDYPPLDVQTVGDYPADNFQVYTSSNNGSYELYSKDFKVSERIEKRLIRNANGELVFDEPVNCRIIELSGLELDSPYFAVSFNGDPKAFRTIPYSNSCFKVFSSKQQELPVTVSPTLRDTVLTGKSSFPERGFEFEKNGPYYGDSGWRTRLLYGVARGKLNRMRGSLCEAYPQVRTHWLNQIKRFIDLGCDGVDIRMNSHCSSVTDFVNYGFNPPLVQAYKERYGIDIMDQAPDPVKMMKLRGDFFLKFAQEAAALLHQRGLTLQMHLNHYQVDPTIDTTYFRAGFWTQPKVVPDWRGVVDIADEITIKDKNWRKYNPNRSGAIKDLTAAAGKPLWVHCYLQQGNDLTPEFLEAVEADSRVSGLLLYEVKNGIVRVDRTTGQVRLGTNEGLRKLLIRRQNAGFQ